jgi:hypothetical protein
MTLQLDHFIVPARDKVAAAKHLAALLGVRWSEPAGGPFAPVFLNEGLTLDFMDAPDPLPRHHYCFRVTPDDFDAILGRIRKAGIPYRSEVRGPTDGRINTRLGGKNIYWNEPDGHQWEILTVSYARQAP